MNVARKTKVSIKAELELSDVVIASHLEQGLRELFLKQGYKINGITVSYKHENPTR